MMSRRARPTEARPAGTSGPARSLIFGRARLAAALSARSRRFDARRILALPTVLAEHRRQVPPRLLSLLGGHHHLDWRVRPEDLEHVPRPSRPEKHVDSKRRERARGHVRPVDLVGLTDPDQIVMRAPRLPLAGHVDAQRGAPG